MRDTEFYETLLGLSEPWRVTKVALNSPANRVDVWIEDRSGTKWKCPECKVNLLPGSAHGADTCFTPCSAHFTRGKRV